MSKNYAAWKTWLWRLFRGAMAAGLSQALLIQPDFSDPQVAGKVVLLSFITGFIMAIGKAIRDLFDEQDKSSMLNKMPI